MVEAIPQILLQAYVLVYESLQGALSKNYSDFERQWLFFSLGFSLLSATGAIFGFLMKGLPDDEHHNVDKSGFRMFQLYHVFPTSLKTVAGVQTAIEVCA